MVFEFDVIAKLHIYLIIYGLLNHNHTQGGSNVVDDIVATVLEESPGPDFRLGNLGSCLGPRAQGGGPTARIRQEIK